MNIKNVFKKILVVLGMLALFGWMGIGDAIMGALCLAFAIAVALVMHFIETPKETEEKVEKMAEPKKTKEEIEKEQLKSRLAELEKKPPKPSEEPKEPKEAKKPITCPICQKECRNKIDYTRHIAFKHPDKIKLELE